MKKIATLTVLLIAIFTRVAFAVDGTVTTVIDWISGQPVKIVKITWTSTAAGEVWQSVGEVNGKVFAVRTDPSAAVGLVPTDNYDVYVKEFDTAYSYLTTTLENRDTANTEWVAPSNVPLYGNVGFSVSASGDITSGDCWLYVEVPK